MNILQTSWKRIVAYWDKVITNDAKGQMEELMAKSDTELCDEFNAWVEGCHEANDRYRRLCQVMALRLFKNHLTNKP